MDIKFSIKNHNKKRNSGLLFEFIVARLAKATAENDVEAVNKSKYLINKYFNNKTEIFKEFRLINSIIKTQVSSERVANTILSEIKEYIKKFDKSKLNAEKNNLVFELNKIFGSSIYEHHIDKYKIFATTQLLLNNMLSKDPDPILNGKYSDVVVNYLLENKEDKDLEEDDKIIENKNENINNIPIRLVTKLMSDKINKKYGSSLTSEQKTFLKEYVLNNNSNIEFLKESFNKLKSKLLTSLNVYQKKETSDTVKAKINELASMLVNDNFDKTDKLLYFNKCLEMLKLNNDLNGN